MEKDEIIYIANNSDPDNYTQIKKLDDTKYEFKNIGEKAVLYKDNTYFEAVTFLSKFSNLKVFSFILLSLYIIVKKEDFYKPPFYFYGANDVDIYNSLALLTND